MEEGYYWVRHGSSEPKIMEFYASRWWTIGVPGPMTLKEAGAVVVVGPRLQPPQEPECITS